MPGAVSKPALGTEAGGVADTKTLGWCRVGCVPRPCSRGSWPGSRSLSGWAEGGAGGRDAGPRPRPVQTSAGLWEAEEGLRVEWLSAHTPARRPQGSRGSPSAGTRPTSPGSARPWAVDRWRRPSELPSCPDARVWVRGASDPVAQRASAPAKGPGAATTARAPGLRGQVTQCLGSWLGWPGPEDTLYF